MQLETQRCLIRSFCLEDVASLHQVLSNDEVMRYIEPVFTMEQTLQFIQKYGLSSPPLVYALHYKPENRLIGHVIFHPFNHTAYEIGWILHRDYWGNGIADEVTKALIAHAKQLGISTCIIECSKEQIASKKLAQKNGFQLYSQENDLLCYRLELNK